MGCFRRRCPGGALVGIALLLVISACATPARGGWGEAVIGLESPSARADCLAGSLAVGAIDVDGARTVSIDWLLDEIERRGLEESEFEYLRTSGEEDAFLCTGLADSRDGVVRVTYYALPGLIGNGLLELERQ